MPLHRRLYSPLGLFTLAFAALWLVGCEQSLDKQTSSTPSPTAPTAASDPYDQSKMDFKPGPATPTDPPSVFFASLIM